jgi:predicted transcriptional regulator
MKKVNFYFSTPQYTALKAIAKRLDTTISALIRRAVDDWLKRNRGMK